MSLKKASDLAMSLSSTIEDVLELAERGDTDQLNCGLHMLSLYEQLMSHFEAEIHPIYIKQIEEFRKTIPYKYKDLSL